MPKSADQFNKPPFTTKVTILGAFDRVLFPFFPYSQAHSILAPLLRLLNENVHHHTELINAYFVRLYESRSVESWNDKNFVNEFYCVTKKHTHRAVGRHNHCCELRFLRLMNE
jgi:hypothetical protein